LFRTGGLPVTSFADLPAWLRSGLRQNRKSGLENRVLGLSVRLIELYWRREAELSHFTCQTGLGQGGPVVVAGIQISQGAELRVDRYHFLGPDATGTDGIK
jgi:hypothetical protein